MCNCIAGWVVDEEVEGTHNVQPVTCATYTAALEDLIRSGNADSLDLERVQKAHGISRRVVAIDPANPDSWIQVDTGNGKFPPFVSMIQPYVADHVRGINEWREEIMASIAKARSTRIMIPEGFELTMGWFGEDFDMQRETMAAHMRENGFAVWARPDEGLELNEDGYYRPVDRSKWNLSE